MTKTKIDKHVRKLMGIDPKDRLSSFLNPIYHISSKNDLQKHNEIMNGFSKYLCPNCNKHFTRMECHKEEFNVIFHCDRCMCIETWDDDYIKSQVKSMVEIYYRAGNDLSAEDEHGYLLLESND